MTRFSPTDLRSALRSGLLSFPVTHIRPDLGFDEAGYRSHVEWLGQFPATGLFAAGGTGEFFSLTHDEVDSIVAATVQSTPEEMPVVAPAGYGTSTAVQMAQRGEANGADGIFLLPPYLTELDQEGLYQHVAAVCRVTSLGVVVYHRANARFTADTVGRLVEEFDNFIGFKDGICDIDLMATLHAQHGDRLVYVGGLPTAGPTRSPTWSWAPPPTRRRSSTSRRGGPSTSTPRCAPTTGPTCTSASRTS